MSDDDRNGHTDYHADAKRQQVVLFGGYSADGTLNDTWVWDGKDWSQLATPNSPPLGVGIYPALAYDDAKG